ncbi:MAG: bifunctional DNA primase/polymerase [Planctomycetaceae bacterium]|jgi:hypothetical protein|nr:bifunctional DNA primase/polymerase [Planctomycetaceae bacterium]
MPSLEQKIKRQREYEAHFRAQRLKASLVKNEVIDSSENTTTDTSVDSYADALNAITKVCPECKEIVRTHVGVCPDCGYEFQDVPLPTQKEVKNNSNNDFDSTLSDNVVKFSAKPKKSKSKSKKRKLLTPEESEAIKQKRERERQEALDRIERLKEQKDDDKKAKRKKREQEKAKRKKEEQKRREEVNKRFTPIQFEEARDDMRQLRIDADSSKDSKTIKEAHKTWRKEYSKWRKEEIKKYRKEEKRQKGINKVLKRLERELHREKKKEARELKRKARELEEIVENAKKAECREERQKKSEENRLAFHRLQAFRRDYLLKFPKNNPHVPDANENKIDYSYLSQISDEVIDPSYDELYEKYRRKSDNRNFRIYKGVDGRTYKQCQNKRDNEKWNKPIEQNLGISQKEVFRVARAGFYVCPLTFGTNIPLGSPYSVRDEDGHCCFKNGGLIYGVRDAVTAPFFGKIREMFRFGRDGISPYNLAITCVNITVLDFDSFWSEKTQRYVKFLCAKYGKFSKALVAFTPGSEKHGPGVHLYFLKCDGLKSNSIIPGAFDVKSDAHSYVSAPGSVREKDCYFWLDKLWIANNKEQYEKLKECISEIIPFDDFKDIKQLGRLTDLQKEGIQTILNSGFTGSPRCDLEDEYLTEEGKQNKYSSENKTSQELDTIAVPITGTRVPIAKVPTRKVTLAELAALQKEDKEEDAKYFADKKKSKQEKSVGCPCETFTDDEDTQTDDKSDKKTFGASKVKESNKATVEQPKATQTIKSPFTVKEKSIPDPTKSTDEIICDFLGVRAYTTYDKILKVWIGDRDRTQIHIGWKNVFQYDDENDVDKRYLLWKTVAHEIPVGNRNLALTSVAGLFCCETNVLQPIEILIKTMQIYNNDLKTPLPEKEVEKICKSIHHRSLIKRGGDPNVVLGSKIKNETNAKIKTDSNVALGTEAEAAAKTKNKNKSGNIFTKTQKISNWFKENATTDRKKNLCLKVFEVIAMSSWDFNAGEDSYFDLTEFKKLVNDGETPNHSDGQTILHFLRTLFDFNCERHNDETKKRLTSKRKKIFYADKPMQVHSVIMGIAFNYKDEAALHKLAELQKSQPVTDSYLPRLVWCGGCKYNNFFIPDYSIIGVNNTNNAINSDSTMIDTVSKSNYSGCFRVSREEIRIRSFNSFIYYLDQKFGCFFLDEFFDRISKILSDNSDQNTHTVV